LSQLSFPFQDETNFYREEDFLALAENLVARNFLQKFFAQEKFSSAQLPSLILKGAEASGKTHLLHIFVQKFAAKFLNKEEIFSANPVEFFCADKFYILEDFYKITDEEALLRLVNSAHEAGAFLLLSTRELQSFHLKDLNSRLKNIVIVAIENPGIEAMEHLLMNRLARRQIRPSKRLIKSILNRIKRSYAAVNEEIS
jgi:hypothetical protein